MTKRAFTLAAVLALGLTAAKAQSDGVLLDALVKKGVLSDQEAEDIRAQEAKDYSTTSAGKLTISDHISNLKLYGDGRFRYEYINEQAQNPGPTTQGANRLIRERFRLRLGADYTFTDHFKAGVELETATADDSANQTFGPNYSKYPIEIGLMYLQWQPTDWLTLTGGKQRNPLYTTDLLWDADINPEGGSEVFNWNIPMDGETSLTVGFTALQGIFVVNNTGAIAGAPPAGTVSNQNVWQFAQQVPVQFNFNKTTFVKVAPGFLTYLDGGNTSAVTTGAIAQNATGGGALNYQGPRSQANLAIITAPGEFDIKLGDLPSRLYWDFAYNVDAKDRVQQQYLGFNQQGFTPSATANQNTALSDGLAWLVGVQVGQNKKKGDWSIRGDYRQVGLGSIDPNINDSDWADSFLNQQGIRVQTVYNFTDFLTGSITYFNTWALKDNLFNTGGQTPGGLPENGGNNNYVVNNPTTAVTGLAGLHASQRLQVDLIWKF
jgi:hypothetical protein